MPPVLEGLDPAIVGSQGGLIRALHWVQEKEGCIPADHQAALADLFNLTRAEVKGVVSFYDDFRAEKAGTHVIRLCQAEACQAVGARVLTNYARQKTGMDLGDTEAEGALTLEGVHCLGLCASGPAALVDGKPMGRLDEAALGALIDQLAASS